MADNAVQDTEQSHAMTRGDDLFMRANYLIRRTCDQLSRDLMTHVLRVIHGQSWDTFAGNPRNLPRNKFIENRFGSQIPSLDECDTTTLNSFFRGAATFSGELSKRIDDFDDIMEEIVRFRNDAAHLTNQELTDEQYDNRLNEFLEAIKSYEPAVFPNLTNCRNFLETNRHQTLAQFCEKYPEELTFFVNSLEKNLTKIAEKLDCLRPFLDKVAELNSRVTVTEAKVEHLEQIIGATRSAQLPTNNLPNIPLLAGREPDLQELDDKFRESQIVSIFGPPGIGKTSLAIAYAKQHQKQITDGVIESEHYIYLHIKLIEVNASGMTDIGVKQNIAKKIGALFPTIATGLSESEDPFGVLISHMRDILTHKPLFLILDNIDTVLDAQRFNVVESVLQDLTSLSDSFRVMTTSRDKRLMTYSIHLEELELKPITSEACRLWIESKNQKSSRKINEEIMNDISRNCGGIPLVLMIMYAVAKLNRSFFIENIKNRREWNQLSESLELSFKLLTYDQTQVMNCASVFNNTFEREVLEEVFQKVGEHEESVIDALEACCDLSLVENDNESSKFYLHPYIKEHVFSKLIKDIQYEKFQALFVVSYFEKILQVADEQLNRDTFLGVLDKVSKDSHNFEKFMQTLSSQNQFQVDCFREHVQERGNEFSCFWVLNGLWFLDKIGQFKNKLLSVAEELEKIFGKLSMLSHEIVTACFIAHKLRLKNDSEKYLPAAAVQIQRAFELSASLSGPMEDFCLGYIYYSMGSFIQQTNIRKWLKMFEWEYTSANEHLVSALNLYSTWKNPVGLIEPNRFLAVREVELHHISLFHYREVLNNAQTESQRDSCFENLSRIVILLRGLLGTHEDVAYAIKKWADHLKHNGRRAEASAKYAQVFEMYNLFGPEIKIQQVVVLKEWSDCVEDKKEALQKLQLAKAILDENHMQNHIWYRTVPARIKSCLKNLGTPAA